MAIHVKLTTKPLSNSNIRSKIGLVCSTSVAIPTLGSSKLSTNNEYSSEPPLG
ncbi:hypothetical protein Csa_018880, partial [Cucumis sativus]